YRATSPRTLHAFPTRRSSDLTRGVTTPPNEMMPQNVVTPLVGVRGEGMGGDDAQPARRLPSLRVIGQLSQSYIVAEGPDGMYLRSEEHTSELQSLAYLVCRLL